MAGALAENGNLTGYTVGESLSLQDAEFVIEPILQADSGAQFDYNVHQGIIGGLEANGNGTGNIVPTDVDISTAFPSLVQGDRKPVNIARAAQYDIVVPHVNGDSVLFVLIADSSGTLTARFVT
jgi:hypothetical protein